MCFVPVLLFLKCYGFRDNEVIESARIVKLLIHVLINFTLLSFPRKSRLTISSCPCVYIHINSEITKEIKKNWHISYIKPMHANQLA
jgi:hypothetical protein